MKVIIYTATVQSTLYGAKWISVSKYWNLLLKTKFYIDCKSKKYFKNVATVYVL